MKEEIDWKSYYQQEPIEPDIYFKCVCFYNAVTEMYDRSLTDMRSPYDKTEAYITGESRSFSNSYAREVYDYVMKYISYKTEEKFDRNRWVNANIKGCSAQYWIDVFEQLKKNEDEVICNMIKHFNILNPSKAAFNVSNIQEMVENHKIVKPIFN